MGSEDQAQHCHTYKSSTLLAVQFHLILQTTLGVRNKPHDDHTKLEGGEAEILDIRV